jgi:hypothetical protein
MTRMTRNACRCRKCNTVIESRHVHDFVMCPCGSVFTDGGLHYIRRGGELEHIEDMSEYDEEDVDR